ncbi:UNVERIFIED_CONTAM: hypothetical protein NCL1_39799 [Trichonephila clavipes]
MDSLQQCKPLRKAVSTQGIIRSDARTTLTNKKMLICISRDSCGVIYKEYLKCRQTINSTMYSNMLIKVSDAIREK